MGIINVVCLKQNDSSEKIREYKCQIENYVDQIYILDQENVSEEIRNMDIERICKNELKQKIAEQDWIFFSGVDYRYAPSLLKRLKDLTEDPYPAAYSATLKFSTEEECYWKGSEREEIFFVSNKTSYELNVHEDRFELVLEKELCQKIIHINDGYFYRMSGKMVEKESFRRAIPYEESYCLPSQKRVLITNLFVQKYTGSELHTLSVAKQFLKKGYEVIVAVFVKAYPLAEYFEGIPGLHVVNCLEYHLPFQHYDIFWAQHYAVADWVILKNHITCDRLVVSRLGIYNALEALPCFAKKADMICCVSREIEERIRKEIGNERLIEKLENCVDEEFFDEYTKKKRETLQSIAVVSNHMQDDILKAVEKLREHGIEVKLYGQQYEAVLITGKVLSHYDVVITIGKTVQYGLACGTIPYIYDYYGGPGYLTEENFELARKFNFSGRGFQRKENAEEIVTDILENYQKAIQMRENWHKKAEQLYRMNDRFDVFYERLLECPAVIKEMSSYYDPIEKERLLRYAEGINGTLDLHISKAKVYFDLGNGLSEMCTEEYSYVEGQAVHLSLEVPDNCKRVRFDPMEAFCKCRLTEVKAAGRAVDVLPADSLKENGWDIFLNEDPQYCMLLKETGVVMEITFIAEQLKCNSISRYSYLQKKEMEQRLRDSEKQIVELQCQIEEMKNTKVWKMGEIIRKIKK